MKYLFIFLLTFTALSQRAFVKDNHQSLDIDSKKNGRCKYTRNQLNKAQLNNIYGTNLKHPVKNTSAEYIQKNFNCIFIARNFKRDSNKSSISPDKVFSNLKQEKSKTKKVQGKIRYLGVIPKKYKYTLSSKNEMPTVSLKIFFEVTQKIVDEQKKIYEQDKKNLIERLNNPSDDVFKIIYNDEVYRSSALIDLLDKSLISKKKILDQFRTFLQAAELIWESEAGLGYNFEFSVAQTQSEADFTVKLSSDGSRGPYDKEWSLKWGVRTIAHEVGHMMGLDDEYDNALESTIAGLNAFLINKDNKLSLKKMVCQEYEDLEDRELFGYFRKMSFGSDRASKCDKTSIMCDHLRGSPKKWHIYTIFKRFYL